MTNFKDSQKFFKELDINGFKEKIIAKVASEFLGTLKEKSSNIKELPNYKNKLEVKKAKSEEFAYAVALEQSSAKLPLVEPAIIYLKNIYKVPSLMFSLLYKFQPFTQYTLPFIPDEKVVRTIYRLTSKEKFNEVYSKNLSDWNKMSDLLFKAGITPRQIDDIPVINVYEDMADRIGKIELTSKAHWRPTIESFRSGKFLQAALQKERLDKVKELNISDTYSREDEVSFQEFSKEIL